MTTQDRIQQIMYRLSDLTSVRNTKREQFLSELEKLINTYDKEDPVINTNYKLTQNFYSESFISAQEQKELEIKDRLKGFELEASM